MRKLELNFKSLELVKGCPNDINGNGQEDDDFNGDGQINQQDQDYYDGYQTGYYSGQGDYYNPYEEGEDGYDEYNQGMSAGSQDYGNDSIDYPGSEDSPNIDLNGPDIDTDDFQAPSVSPY